MSFRDCIVTDRLILRRFDEGDAEDVFALMRDDYIAERAGFRPFKSLGQTQKFMDDWQEWAYVITERGSNTVIGIIQTPRTGWFNVAIGYWLSAEYRGLGYMTEAVEAVKEYLFDEFRWCNEITIYVYCGNDSSRNVALKCGFYPKYDAYRECVYSRYGKAESEECFTMTRGDYEWECRGESYFTTAPLAEAA